MRGRALLLRRLEEQREGVDAAMRAYRSVLGLDGLDADTQEEARISLARVLLDDLGSAARRGRRRPPARGGGDGVGPRPPGRARTRMGEGDAEAALAAYDAVAQTADLFEDLSQAARAQAEALASLGELAEATEIWRALLSEDPDPSERAEIELQLAQGLLQGNELEEAADAFASPRAFRARRPVRGLLGQAGVARVQGARARTSTSAWPTGRRTRPTRSRRSRSWPIRRPPRTDRRRRCRRGALLGIVPPATPPLGRLGWR